MSKNSLLQSVAQFYRQDPVRFWFRVGMWWRIFYGSMRIVLAVFLLRFVHAPITDVWHALSQHELLEDPGDLIIRLFGGVLNHVKDLPISPFLPAYLIFWGIVDIGLSGALLLEKRWAFPLGGGLIGFFLVYEIYRFFHTHSLILLGVICLDAVLLWLIRSEYKRHFRV